MNLFGQYKSIKIEKNDYIENEIVQIDFREFSTLVHFKFRSNSLVGNVIYINEAFYIKDNKTNKKYKLLNSYNLPLGNNNKYAVLEEEDEIIHYTLEFEKVPDSAENLDIIESLKGEAFNFYGVSINKKIKEDNFMDINTFTKETPIKEMKAKIETVKVPIVFALSKFGKKSKRQAGSFSFNPSIPPTCSEFTIITAKIIQPVIAKTNCKASVIATPNNPEIEL